MYGAGDGVRTRDMQLGKPEAVPHWFTAGSPISGSFVGAVVASMERKLLSPIDLGTLNGMMGESAENVR
jgi:hypothetical protein